MTGLLSLASLLLLAGNLDVNASVRAEAQGGEGPIQALEAPRPGVIWVITPGVSLELLRPSLEIKLEYGPRIFWRLPNESGACPADNPQCLPNLRGSRASPLILHTVNLLGTARTSRRTTVSGGGSLSVGEPDYSTLPLLLGMVNAPQAALPVAVEVLSVSARAGLEVLVSRAWEVGAVGEFAYRKSIGTAPRQVVSDMVTIPVTVFPTQTSLRLDPSVTGHLTGRDDLLLVGTVSYMNLSYLSGAQTVNPEFVTVTPQVGWKRELTRETDLRLLAGITYVGSRGVVLPQGTASTTMVKKPNPISPVGSGELRSLFLRSSGFAMATNVGATVEYFVDPILGQASPRGTASARIAALVANDWDIALEGMFGTSLSGSPLAGFTVMDMSGGMRTIYPDETVASATLPVRHRVSDKLVFEFGGRWSDRRPHLSVSGSGGFHQRQLWAYVAITASTKESIRWTRP